MTRYRVRLTEERAREVNRVQNTLEGTNLKLGNVVSDIMGKASRMILWAIADGESDPARLASLATGRVRANQEQLATALTATISDHHRFLLREHLTQIEHLERAVERITAEIVRRLAPPDPADDAENSKPGKSEGKEESTGASQPFLPPSKQGLSWEEAVILLVSIPGMSERAACGILAEIGVNMQQFPTAAHLASWAGVCPGNHESAGKRLSGKTRHPAIPGCVVSYSKRLTWSRARSTAICQPNFVASPLDEEKTGGDGRRSQSSGDYLSSLT